jgi:hypothetical protein
MVLLTSVHKQCDVIQILTISNVNIRRLLASCTLQMWINFNKKMF